MSCVEVAYSCVQSKNCSEKTILMYSLWHEVCFLSSNTRSICCYIKHNDSYRPIILSWWWKILSVKCGYEKGLAVCVLLLSVLFEMLQFTACGILHWDGPDIHASYWCFFQFDYTLGIFFKCGKWNFFPGLYWYNFPAALDAILINMLKAQQMKINIFPSWNS